MYGNIFINFDVFFFLASKCGFIYAKVNKNTIIDEQNGREKIFILYPIIHTIFILYSIIHTILEKYSISCGKREILCKFKHTQVSSLPLMPTGCRHFILPERNTIFNTQ